jgi:hypothetical protein
MNSAFEQAVAYFNAESYRDALLAFEECWFEDRSDFLRGLIQLCNALNQLRLGLVTAPRRTLASAARLLAPYAPAHCGLDIAALCVDIAGVRACIPDNIESGEGRVAWDALPRPRLLCSRERIPPAKKIV